MFFERKLICNEQKENNPISGICLYETLVFIKQTNYTINTGLSVLILQFLYNLYFHRDIKKNVDCYKFSNFSELIEIKYFRP